MNAGRRNCTRAALPLLILVLAALADLLAALPVSAANAWFADTTGHWAEAAIGRAAVAGLLVGNPDGSFAPDAPLSRAAAIKIMVQAAGLRPMGGPLVFSDIPGHWVATMGYVQAAVWSGLIVPQEYGAELAADAPATREEIAVMAARASGISSAPGYPPYRDWDQVSPNRVAGVGVASALGFVTGFPDGTFRPQAPLTRAQAAVVAVRVLEYRQARWASEGAPVTEPPYTGPPPAPPDAEWGPIYPDTDAPPAIDLFFDPAEISEVGLKAGRFGIIGQSGPGAPDGLEGAAVPLRPPARLFAPFKGTVTRLEEESDFPGQWKLVIRYGRRYGTFVNHIERVPADIKLGGTVEQGQYLGEAYWVERKNGEEIRLAEVWFTKADEALTRQGMALAICPRPLFTATARQVLDAAYARSLPAPWDPPGPRPATYCAKDERPTYFDWTIVRRYYPQMSLPFPRDRLLPASFRPFTADHFYFEFDLQPGTDIRSVGGALVHAEKGWAFLRPTPGASGWGANTLIMYGGLETGLPARGSVVADGQRLGTAGRGFRFGVVAYLENTWRLISPIVFQADRAWLESLVGVDRVSTAYPAFLDVALGIRLDPPGGR